MRIVLKTFFILFHDRKHVTVNLDLLRMYRSQTFTVNICLRSVNFSDIVAN